MYLTKLVVCSFLFACLRYSNGNILDSIEQFLETEEEILQYKEFIYTETAKSLVYTFDDDASRYKPINSTEVTNLGSFDFIIVGGGTTGSVIASRLSEVNQWNILLLEAGDLPNNVTDMPALGWLAMSSDYNWGIKGKPQTTCCQGFSEKRCPYPRGRGLGGTSLINANLMARGSPKDYEQWVQLGNAGWSYEDVLPYYLKSEDFHDNKEYAPVNWDYHNTGGLFSVGFNSLNDSRTRAFINGFIELGYNITDYNTPEQKGASPVQVNLRDGKRDDAGTAFVLPFLNRTNLRVMTKSYVTKIDINNVTKTANGVYFSNENKLYYAEATKEVILSAGALQSPQLLMLSGVGPKDHLDNVGVEVIQDLEVGSTLRDHHNINLFYVHNATDDLLSTLSGDILNYLEEIGKLTSFNFMSCLSFLTTPLATDPDYTDTEISLMTGFPTNIVPLQNKAMKFSAATIIGMLGGIALRPFFPAYVVNLHPKSVGTVRLENNDPFTYPIVDSNMFSVQEDIDHLYESLQLMRTLLNTEPFKKINAQIPPLYFASCGTFDLESKDYWTCIFKQMAFPSFHPSGTCQMGPNPSEGAVVDANLTVYGVNKLRVADASIFPITMSNHLMATCLMIGEKLSDMIKKEYGVI